jgi:xanthine dehydrogenase accessory factor
LGGADKLAVVEVEAAYGSTPRESGAWMLISAQDICGTIGGGQLEFLAIAKARELIAENRSTCTLNIPLGPEIGQCCGGRVKLAIDLVDAGRREILLSRVAVDEEARPYVFLFGGGHVGHALANALVLLPLNITLVETRGDVLQNLPEGINARLTSLPEGVVRDAPPGSAFLILTHDHALDFLIAAEALARTDARYVGMIGSKTKRATFKNWYLRQAMGEEKQLSRLVCPIGGNTVCDKRPSVIAAVVTAEVTSALIATAPEEQELRAAVFAGD